MKKIDNSKITINSFAYCDVINHVTFLKFYAHPPFMAFLLVRKCQVSRAQKYDFSGGPTRPPPLHDKQV